MDIRLVVHVVDERTGKTVPTARFETVDPLEVARQLALLDEEYYRCTSQH